MEYQRTRSVFVALLAAAGVITAAACSSEPCNQDPFQCGGGQTCALTAPGLYSCVNAGTESAGAPCADVQGAASCGEKLFCYLGTCAPFCDSSNACPSGTTCQPVSPGGESSTVPVCVGGLP